MEKAEIILFIVLTNVILIIFITGILAFLFQNRKRKIMQEKEKLAIEVQHKLDLLHFQVQVQQQTMQFIGSEIHDTVAQKLTLASIYSQKLEFENRHNGISEKLETISGIINDSLTELRDLSRTLTDSRMQQTSLTDLLRVECERVNDSGICKAMLVPGFEEEMSVTVKRFLLRVVQEFIQNSLKHAGCSLIRFQLEKKDGHLSIIASDNGKGFDYNDTPSKGIGLSNMIRRIQMIGGTFILKSEPGKGTELQMLIACSKLIS